MSITVQQIPAAVAAVKSLDSILNDIRMLLEQAKDLSDKNWQIDIGSRAPLVVTISPAQQASMISQYDAYKTNLVAVFNTLP